MYGKYTVTIIAGVNKETHRFFCRLIRALLPLQLVRLATFALSSLTLSSLSVSRTELPYMFKRGGKEPKSDDTKKRRVSSFIFLYSYPMDITNSHAARFFPTLPH